MKTLRILLLFLSCLLLAAGCKDEPAAVPEPAQAAAPESLTQEKAPAEILPGVEVLARDHAPDLAGKRVAIPVSYTHLTLPTMLAQCRSRWSPYH